MREYRNVIIEITDRCNLACKGCYREHRETHGQDMSFNMFGDILREIPSPTNVILFSDGEPLLHPHLPAFIEAAGERGHRVTIGTNGTQYDQAVTDMLFKYKGKVCVSIDGYYPKTVKYLRGANLMLIEESVINYTSAGLNVGVSMLRNGQDFLEEQFFITSWTAAVNYVVIRKMLKMEPWGVERTSDCRQIGGEFITFRVNGTIPLCERNMRAPIQGTYKSIETAEAGMDEHDMSGLLNFCDSCGQRYTGEKEVGTCEISGHVLHYTEDYFNKIYSEVEVDKALKSEGRR